MIKKDFENVVRKVKPVFGDAAQIKALNLLDSVKVEPRDFDKAAQELSTGK